MIRSQLQHATEKIADGDASRIYAPGLSSVIFLKFEYINEIISFDRIKV